jgi:hypothetical protein
MNLIWTSKFKLSFRGLEQFIYKLIIEDIYEISQVVFNFYWSLYNYGLLNITSHLNVWILKSKMSAPRHKT